MLKPGSVEMCAGAGGQAIGLEAAGFAHDALVELDHHACNTLRANRPHWRVFEQDLVTFDGRPYQGIELLAGGLPCPPFSKAGKQLGENDERNLFPHGIRLIDEIRPEAVMFENVKGMLDAVFDDYRSTLRRDMERLGYWVDWKLLNASDYGVPQLRPRVVIVGIKQSRAANFKWPTPGETRAPSVGETLRSLMAERGWIGANRWADRASEIAPTLVGGSKKHGGPDLGPTRARKAWATLGVNGISLADASPDPDFVGMPRLTIPMIAKLQGFPDDWQITGRKTNAYRQIGNAFPPPVAAAVGKSILEAISVPRSISYRRAV